MTTMWDAQIELPSGACPPDLWQQTTSSALRLDHVISRDEEGRPLSCVGDFKWDWTIYTPRKRKSSLYFYYWLTRSNKKVRLPDLTIDRVARMRELQYLMALRIYRTEGGTLGFAALHRQLEIFRKFACFAEVKACSVRDVLESTDLLDGFIADLPNYRSEHMISCMNFLRKFEATELGFQVAEPRSWKDLLKRCKQYQLNSKQYSPLPTRIYGKLIAGLSEELGDIEAHRERLLAALRAAIDQHACFKNKYPSESPAIGPGLIVQYDLQDYLTNRGFEHSLYGLNSAVADIFLTCKMQIHAFSGMRREEAMYLPFHCMKIKKGKHGRTHCLLVGVTTKLERGNRRRTCWVTTEEDGFRAVRLAQTFAKVIYENLGVDPSDSAEAKDDYPLFPSICYFPWTPDSHGLPMTHFAPMQLEFSNASYFLRTRLCPIIEEADVAELEEIDPFRDWRSEPKFAVGQPWPLSTHQLRRSLALYANASGLVRLSSLRRQLQHITREMAQYYARGSVFAKNFLAEDPKEYKKHICAEWPDAFEEAAYLAFARDVINCDEPLYGPAGAYFDRQKQRGEVMHEKEFKRQMKMGRFAYKDHPLGGCTNAGPCNKEKGLRLTGAVCATEACKHLIGKHSKIIKLIPLQRKVVNNLDPNTITYQMEKEELEALESLETAWRSENSPALDSSENDHV